MRMQTLTFEAVRTIGRDFPDLQESTMYGSPALNWEAARRMHGYSPIRGTRVSYPRATDFEQREALLAEDPATYYVTDHYVHHLVVLARTRTSATGPAPRPDQAGQTCVLNHARAQDVRLAILEFQGSSCKRTNVAGRSLRFVESQ